MRVKEKKQSVLKSGFKFFLLTLIMASSSISLGKEPIQDIDFVYLYPALPLSYRLPKNMVGKQLIFTGTYKKNTKAEHRRERNDILFTPTRVGNSVLVIRDSRRRILTRLVVSVKNNNLHKVAAEVRELLIAVDGIDIKIYNDKVLVDGQVLLPVEMARIQKVVQSYPEFVRSYVSFSPLAQKRIAELLAEEIQSPELSIRYAYNRFLIEGCVNSQEERDRALRIANLYTQYEVNPVTGGASQKPVSPLDHNIKVPCESARKKKEEEKGKDKEKVEKMIQIVVHFVEMSKSFEKSFLFQWTPAIADGGTNVTGSFGNNPGGPAGISAVLTATVSNFFPKLNWAKQFNFARILHNSSLLMENTVEGIISTNTQLPSSVNAEGKTVGGGTNAEVQVKVKPHIKGKGDIIQIQTGISVTSSVDVGSQTRNISTTINVRDGASAVIGGLTSSFLTRDYNKPSNVDGTPLLNLYTGKRYKTEQAQFVVFLTPVIRQSASVGVDEIRRKFRVDE